MPEFYANGVASHSEGLAASAYPGNDAVNERIYTEGVTPFPIRRRGYVNGTTPLGEWH